MPIFSYECSACHFSEDVLRNDTPVLKCPNCGKKKFTRSWNGGSVGLQFKGGGFHSTDYPSLGGSKGKPVMTLRNKSADSKDRSAKPMNVKGVSNRL